ncbi:MAG: hypothetical protein WCV93_03825 [Candidatus Shapirobacteria bacterium]|jgi:hypothetical protein
MESYTRIKSEEELANLRGGFAQEGERYRSNISGTSMDEILEKARTHYGPNVRLETDNIVDGYGVVANSVDAPRQLGYDKGTLMAAIYTKE